MLQAASSSMHVSAPGLASTLSVLTGRRSGAFLCRLPPAGPRVAGRSDLRRCLAPSAALRSSREDVLNSIESLNLTARVYEVKDQQPTWSQGLVARCGQFLGTAVLALAVVVSMPMAADAAKSSGRVGGSSFGRGPAATSYAGHTTSRVTHSTSVVVAPSYGFGGFGYGGFGMSSFMFPSYGYGMAMGGGVNIFSFLLLALGAFVVFKAASTMFGSNSEEDIEEDRPGATATSGACSVVKLQVGLLGMARGLQQDLDRIAGGADTSDPEGLQSVLQETVLTLLRNPSYCVYGGSKFVKASGLDNAEMAFNQMSLEERGKLKGETLSNYSGRSNAKTADTQGSGMRNELIVVTLMVAVEGKLSIPEVMGLQELKDALSKLGAVGADKLLALEVLWTPQEEGDSFTQEELITDFPTLVAL